MKRITDELPKRSDAWKMVNIKCNPELYRKLKAKLKKNKVTVKDFWLTSVNIYLKEK